MIFGAKHGGNQRQEWERWFAWLPVRLEDGRTAWLETVQVLDVVDQRGEIIDLRFRAVPIEPGDVQFL